MISNISSNYNSICELFNFKKVDFLSFEECREEVRKYKFKDIVQYNKNKKNNWPRHPDQHYKNKGWKDWYNFLGKVSFLSFEECRKEVRKYKFKNIIQYNKNKKNNWPSSPNKHYKNKGWKDWYDFLGK